MAVAAGERIKLLRHSYGMTLAQVAEATSISERKLQTIEKSLGQLEEEHINSIAAYYNCDPELLAIDVAVTDVGAISDQTQNVSARDLGMINAQTRLWLERYLFVHSVLPSQDNRITGYPKGFPRSVASGKEAVDAASALRETLGLSNLTPVGYLTDLLEQIGVRVAFIPGVENFSALAMLTKSDPTLPVIAVRQDLSGDIQRFAMARELAFYLLENCTSQLASHFAGALLLPADALRFDIGTDRADMEVYELLLLKEKYGVSIHHILARAASLGIIEADLRKQLVALFEQMNWNVNAEPGDPYPPEESRLLIRRVIRLQLEEVIGIQQAAHLLGMTLDEWMYRLTLSNTIPVQV